MTPTVRTASELADAIFANARAASPPAEHIAALWGIADRRRARALDRDDPYIRAELAFFAAPPPEAGPFAGPLDPVDVLQAEVTLPALPTVYAELIEVVENPDSSAADLAAVISKDPGLTAYVLRLVNSALYGFPSRIDTVTRAVAVLGMQRIESIALGTSILRSFRDVRVESFDLESFWRHSLGVSILARELAHHVGMDNPERSFVGGLLHDLGRLVLAICRPDAARASLSLARTRDISLRQAEQELLGFDHGRLGGMLLRKWNFPYALVMDVHGHHEPSGAKNAQESALIHAADVLAHVAGYGGSGDALLPRLDTPAWLGLAIAPEALEAFIDSADEQLGPLQNLLVA
jgi:putative nucleotidyltransferase with HDIG domain